MWWLIVVGIILIGIWMYYTFFRKEITGYMGEEDTEDSSRNIKDGVNWIIGWLRSGRISNETDIYEADAQRTQAKVKSTQVGTELLAAQRAQKNLEDEGRRQDELREAQQQTSLAAEKDKQLDYETRGHLFAAAASKGLDITTYLQIISHRELKAIDLQARAEEYRQDQEQISRVQQEKLELVDRATHRLFSMYEQRAQIEASDDPAKEAKLGQLNYNIQIAERLIRGEQDRYLQAALGEETKRALPPGDGDGSDTAEDGTDGEQLSLESRGPGRPRGSKDKSRRKRKSSSYSGDDGGGQE